MDADVLQLAVQANAFPQAVQKAIETVDAVAFQTNTRRTPIRIIMTTEELKAHRRAICEALIEGKQCQMMVTGQWTDQNPQTAACNLFSDWKPEFIRIKPEPRKCWVGWKSGEDGSWHTDDEEDKNQISDSVPGIKWQTVVEEVK